ncbi:Collagen alpha-1(XXVII) chain B [Liparis tanakae]|uniref:Collagen alpha-1(XXVII) chain B n=1 Tax=Liparis tanakae TaxID=230148 RepID=A0A4Z2GZD4_9TELE|nr:Collagen alpha-1(XXVII) chain B [Liparis tanakae]
MCRSCSRVYLRGGRITLGKSFQGIIEKSKVVKRNGNSGGFSVCLFLNLSTGHRPAGGLLLEWLSGGGAVNSGSTAQPPAESSVPISLLTWKRRALLLCTVLYCTCYLGLTQVHSEDVDILQKLGLKGEKPWRSVPTGVIPFRSGIILNQRAHIEAPLRSLFPAAIWPNLALVLSVRSHRVNSAFLFTLLSGRKKLLLGLQLAPGHLVLHTGPNTSVALPYEPHDGQWHQLSVGINGQRVTLYASCGEQSVHADFGWDGEEALAPELQGSFLLGRSSQQQASAHFEGAICQFDLVPSAQAAHNYCSYIKKQCREADTYRPNLPPLLPILPREANVTATAATPKRGGSEMPKKTTGKSLARSVAAAASAKPQQQQPTTTKKISPKPKVMPSKATPSKPKTNYVKVVPSKPTVSKVNPSKPTISKVNPSKPTISKVNPTKPTISKVKPSKPTISKPATAKTSKPVTKQVIKPTKQAKTTKATVTPRPTRSSYNPVTPPATDGFLSWEGLPGPPGKPGLPGKKGPRGTFGPHGNPGRSGPSGLKGRKGDPGISPGPAPKGEKGDSGIFGPVGLTGQEGRKVRSEHAPECPCTKFLPMNPLLKAGLGSHSKL